MPKTLLTSYPRYLSLYPQPLCHLSVIRLAPAKLLKQVQEDPFKGGRLSKWNRDRQPNPICSGIAGCGATRGLLGGVRFSTPSPEESSKPCNGATQIATSYMLSSTFVSMVQMVSPIVPHPSHKGLCHPIWKTPWWTSSNKMREQHPW